MTRMFPVDRSLLRATEASCRAEKPTFGLVYVWAIPIVGALIHLCAIEVGGLLLSGVVWMGMLACGVMLFTIEPSVMQDRRVYFPWLPWMPFVAWMATSLFWVDGIGRENIQDVFIISMPVLVGVIASATIHTERQLQRLIAMFGWALLVLVVAFVSEFVKCRGVLGDMGFRMGSLTGALIAAVFLAGTWKSRIRPWIFWFLSFAMAAIPGARAATMAVLGLPLLHPRLGTWKSRAVLIGGTVFLSCGLMQTKHFQERFFHNGGSGSFSDIDSVNTSGRGEAWPMIFRKAMERPITGFGVGTSGDYVDEICELGGHPHNDYLRVFFEQGFVGLILFLGALAWQTLFLFRMLRNKTGYLQQAFAAAIMGWFVFMGTSLTDNTLVYAAAYMNPLFALIGAGCGVTARQRAGTSIVESFEGEIPDVELSKIIDRNRTPADGARKPTGSGLNVALFQGESTK